MFLDDVPLKEEVFRSPCCKSLVSNAAVTEEGSSTPEMCYIYFNVFI